MKLPILQIDLNVYFPLIAISTSLKSFEVAWLLEYHLDLCLHRKDDVRLFSKNNRYNSFDRFNAAMGTEEADEPIFILVANKDNKELLVPEANFDWVDFYIRFSDETNPEFIESVKNTLTLHQHMKRIQLTHSSQFIHSERFIL